jgi:DNA gyrase/topoisomerase IV subunit B
MATIPNLAPQPEQEQQQHIRIQMNVEVQPGQTVFKAQVSPFEIKVMPVPDNIMAMAVQTWLVQHPELAFEVIRQVKHAIQQNEAMGRAIQVTRND